MATIRKIVVTENAKRVRVDPKKDRRPAKGWYAQVFVGRNPATHRPQFVSRVFGRRKDADEWVREQEGLKDSGGRPATTRETFAEFLERWLPVHASRVRATTSYNAAKTVGKWVLRPPTGVYAIGGRQLRKLGVRDFDRLYLSMGKVGMRPRAIRYLHGLLKQALKDAVRKDELPRNPAEYATLPRHGHAAELTDDGCETGRVEALDREQARRFLAAARELDWHSALWHVLLTGGLRPGEALALRWADVKLDRAELLVRATLTRVGVDGWTLTQPKTTRSRRTVPLPDLTVGELRRWKVEQARERLAAGAEWQDHGFVFTNGHGGPLNLSNLARRCYRRIMERAGLGECYGREPKKPRHGPTARRPFRPSHRIYALRHTFATLLLADGVPLLVVSRLMGHTSIQLTADVYSHVLPTERNEAAGRFDRLFG